MHKLIKYYKLWLTKYYVYVSDHNLGEGGNWRNAKKKKEEEKDARGQIGQQSQFVRSDTPIRPDGYTVGACTNPSAKGACAVG